MNLPAHPTYFFELPHRYRLAAENGDWQAGFVAYMLEYHKFLLFITVVIGSGVAYFWWRFFSYVFRADEEEEVG